MKRKCKCKWFLLVLLTALLFAGSSQTAIAMEAVAATEAVSSTELTEGKIAMPGEDMPDMGGEAGGEMPDMGGEAGGMPDMPEGFDMSALAGEAAGWEVDTTQITDTATQFQGYLKLLLVVTAVVVLIFAALLVRIVIRKKKILPGK